jgi:hypothetical protein
MAFLADWGIFFSVSKTLETEIIYIEIILSLISDISGRVAEMNLSNL